MIGLIFVVVGAVLLCLGHLEAGTICLAVGAILLIAGSRVQP